MSLPTETVQRIERVKASIKISDLVPQLKPGKAIDCPKCGRRGKFQTWEDTHGKCWSTWCDWNKRVDVITIYQHLNQLDGKGAFYRALEDLEYRAGLFEHRYQYKSNILESALKVYQERLLESKAAKDYLLGRGWDLDKLINLGVGYAPHSRILRDFGLDRNELIEAELFDGEKEFFYNRVIFPIRNIHGSLVRLTGRNLDKRSELKWLHSKGGMKQYLILEDKIPQYKEQEAALLCEGYPDTYTLFEMGLPTLGTCGLRGLTQHAQKLEGFKELIAIYDIDTHPEGHPIAGEYKSWSQVIPQLIELQYLLPDSNISLWFLPGEGRTPKGKLYTGAKDINEYVLASGVDKDSLWELIQGQKVNLIEYCIKKWGQDLGYHTRLLKLCQTTGRGADLLEQYIPPNMGKLEYAMSVLGA